MVADEQRLMFNPWGRIVASLQKKENGSILAKWELPATILIAPKILIAALYV